MHFENSKYSLLYCIYSLSNCFVVYTFNLSETIEFSSSIQMSDWYLANIKQYGYYRVNYDDQNWDRLMTQLIDNHTVSLYIKKRVPSPFHFT